MKGDGLSLDSSWVSVIDLLSDLVVFSHYDFDEFLKKLIRVTLEVIPVDSCFIYFHDSDKKQLILVASKKPHTGEIGKIVLSEGEGITGWVATHKKTVAIVEHAYQDPRFKFFKELPEDRYESFLSVPILDENGTIGVINLQNRVPYPFSKVEIKAVESLVKIISSAFKKVVLERRVNHLQTKLEERKLIERAKGVLMKIKNLSEDEAHHFMRREAMNKRRSMREIAEAVLLVWKE